jgi:hypothetical protein
MKIMRDKEPVVPNQICTSYQQILDGLNYMGKLEGCALVTKLVLSWKVSA